MLIVASADSHTDHRKLQMPEKADVFIFAGDMSFFDRKKQDYVDFNDWVGELPYKYKLVIPGNHDRRFQEKPEEIPELTSNYIFMHEKEIIINGLKFYGSGNSPWFGGWGYNCHRGKEIAEKWKMIPDDTDILITHGPPYQILDCSEQGENVGCEELAKRVFEIKPKLHLFGHVHGCRGQCKKIGETLFYNVANDYNINIPYVIEI
jgi:Icc-related predicted phosphoesterase